MQDLASLVLTLRPTHQDTIPGWTGRAAHAWFLGSLRDVDPALSSIVHDRNGPKPFTTSSLGGVDLGDEVTLHPDRLYTLRLTTLHADVTRVALNGLAPRWLERGITLHDQPFRVEQISSDTDDDPWAGAASYADLLASHPLSGKGSRAPRITLRFASPTSFNKTGGLQMPLPVPELVFGSLIDRWTAFSSVALHPDLKTFVSTCVAVSDVRIESRRISFERADRGAATGFTGSVTFSLQSSERFWLDQMHTLAAFALYSGIGVRTTMGLGQVRVVRSDEHHTRKEIALARE